MKHTFNLILFLIISTSVLGQCPTAMGDETSYGSGSWVGYFYDGANNFDTEDYQGFATESANFDQSFCGNDCNFTISGCDVNTQTFSVRYRMNQNFTCGTYNITVGGDDGYRLSLDGGATFVINNYSVHSFATTSTEILLDGNYDLVLEYYENTGENRISISITGTGVSAVPGEIGGGETLCTSAGTADPVEITSISGGENCTGDVPAYQWQESTDNISFSDISGATSETYDPAPIAVTTYYKRVVTLGASVLESNTIEITIQSPVGDEITQGAGSWIGYVYDGVDNFTTDYRGEIFETETFDEGFSGSGGSFSTSGCNVEQETFSVRFLMQQTFTCGQYTFTVGADDGYRLSLDGGVTYIIDDYSNHGYRTESEIINLDGVYDLVLDYYESSGGNRVTFDYSVNTTEDGGQIGSDQSFCGTAGADPDLLTNDLDATFCGSPDPINYQWQSSTDNIVFTDISGANADSYDPPTVAVTTYFRRVANSGALSENSNVVTVIVSLPAGDEVTYGSGSWIGYVYDGRDNFATADYLGEIFESEEFDQNFGGNTTTYNTTGCDFTTETFTVRYRMNQTFTSGDYTFVVGGDDGYRLSIDGGSTYVIDSYTDHGYGTTETTLSLDGNYNMVLEYFENSGGNRVSFAITSTTLPVELNFFKAEKATGRTLLNWQTLSEIDNDFFEIERSIDGLVFEKIGEVSGNGTTTTIQNYEWTDNYQSLTGVYYRLRQVDYNGDYEYSHVVFIEPNSNLTSQIYPNPSKGKFTFVLANSMTGEISYGLFDISGKELENGKISATPGGFKFDFTDHQTGVYYLHIAVGNTILRKRIMME